MVEKKLSKKHINLVLRFLHVHLFFKELIRRSLKLEEKLNKTPSYGKHSSRSVVHFKMHIERNFSDLNSFKTINNMTHQYVFKEF